MRHATLILLALCWAAPARADVIYQYVTDAPASAPPGQQFTVNLYLQETLTGTSTSLIAAEKGLWGEGVYVTATGSVPNNGTTISGIVGNTQHYPAGFDGQLITNADRGYHSTTQAWMVGYADFNDKTVGGPSGTTAGGSVSGKVTRALLGQLRLIAGSLGTSTTFAVESFRNTPSSFGGFNDNGWTISFTSGFDLDVTPLKPALTGIGPLAGPPAYIGAGTFSGANAYTFTVLAAPPAPQAPPVVPEPGSLALFLAAASGLGGAGAWRRWRRQ
jgi:hypothetical protein